MSWISLHLRKMCGQIWWNWPTRLLTLPTIWKNWYQKYPSCMGTLLSCLKHRKLATWTLSIPSDVPWKSLSMFYIQTCMSSFFRDHSMCLALVFVRHTTDLMQLLHALSVPQYHVESINSLLNFGSGTLTVRTRSIWVFDSLSQYPLLGIRFGNIVGGIASCVRIFFGPWPGAILGRWSYSVLLHNLCRSCSSLPWSHPATVESQRSPTEDAVAGVIC